MKDQPPQPTTAGVGSKLVATPVPLTYKQDDRNWPAVEQAYFEGMPLLLRKLIVPRLRKNVVQRVIAREVWRRGADACWEQLVALLDRLEDRAPKEGFWSTERPSIADLALFAQLHSLRAPLTPWQSARIAERTALSAYLDRVGAATIGPLDGIQYGSKSARNDVAWSAHG